MLGHIDSDPGPRVSLRPWIGYPWKAQHFDNQHCSDSIVFVQVKIAPMDIIYMVLL